MSVRQNVSGSSEALVEREVKICYIDRRRTVRLPLLKRSYFVRAAAVIDGISLWDSFVDLLQRLIL